MISNFLAHLRTFGVAAEEELVIFDVGSRDCAQSVEFYEAFANSRIVAFECNPQTLPLCAAAAAARADRLTLVPKAVHEYDGVCAFFPIDPAQTITSWSDGNPGASSLFRANGKYEHEHYVQTETSVECTTLASAAAALNITNVDLIWIDLQGAELLALKGLGPLLDHVRFIHIELTFREMYSGQAMFRDVHSFLHEHGFELVVSVSGRGWQEDGIYRNTKK
jgi:FkbM family methyltransferase